MGDDFFKNEIKCKSYRVSQDDELRIGSRVLEIETSQTKLGTHMCELVINIMVSNSRF